MFHNKSMLQTYYDVGTLFTCSIVYLSLQLKNKPLKQPSENVLESHCPLKYHIFVRWNHTNKPVIWTPSKIIWKILLWFSKAFLEDCFENKVSPLLNTGWCVTWTGTSHSFQCKANFESKLSHHKKAIRFSVYIL